MAAMMPGSAVSVRRRRAARRAHSRRNMYGMQSCARYLPTLPPYRPSSKRTYAIVAVVVVIVGQRSRTVGGEEEEDDDDDDEEAAEKRITCVESCRGGVGRGEKKPYKHGPRRRRRRRLLRLK